MVCKLTSCRSCLLPLLFLSASHRPLVPLARPAYATANGSGSAAPTKLQQQQQPGPYQLQPQVQLAGLACGSSAAARAAAAATRHVQTRHGLRWVMHAAAAAAADCFLAT
jgi:hypothetical protein